MQNTIEIKVKEPFIQDFREGVPLISKEAITNEHVLKEEGAIIDLVDSTNNFLGRGYYGRQNKGVGWVLTTKKDEPIDFSFFRQKILKAINKRQGFYQDEETTAFRLFNGEGDGIGGLTIDYFDGYYLINWYSDGIYTFKEQVIQVLDNIGDYKAIYEKKRFDTKGKYMEDDDFVKGERGEFPIIIKENGMRYAVYLNDGAMVGIFLDQREVRKAIRDKYAKGKHVLNTFSYTGAFSIAAALGGADKTTSVDLAKRSKAKTIEQFSVNDIDFEQHDIRVMDVFDYFQYAQRHQLKFDMVVLDPPSFARSKKRTFSTSKDYPKLLMDTISITEKNGVIVASTNNASFGMKKFKGFVEKAFKQMNTGYKILEEYHLPADFQVDRKFQQGNYLKVLFIQVK